MMAHRPTFSFRPRFEGHVSSVIRAVVKDDPEYLREILLNKHAYGHDDLAKALQYAADTSREECLNILLDADALTNVHDASGFTPLILAARRGHANIIRLLLDAKCNIHKATFRVHATALHWAATNGHLDCINLLLTAGCKVDAQTIHRRTPLMLAARSGEEEVVAALLRRGADINHVDSQKASALHNAAEEGCVECVRFLLRADAKVDAKTRHDDTPLMLAARRGHTEVVQLLLHQAKVDLKGRSRQMTVLHWAAEGGHPKVVQLLLRFLLDPNVVTNDMYFGGDFVVGKGVTPLMLACRMGFSETADELLKHGARPDMADQDGMTALLYSIKHDYSDCAKLLLTCGANPDGVLVNVEDSSGIYPDSCDFPEELKPDLQTSTGLSPLLYAIEKNSINVIKVLIRASCDINASSLTGQHSVSSVTPLELVLLKGQFRICQMLLATGCRTHVSKGAGFLEEGLTQLLDDNAQLFTQLVEQLSTPPLLMQLTRTCIRQCMGRRVFSDIESLPLPRPLQRYLDISELDDL